jgi:hypothetical protein
MPGRWSTVLMLVGALAAGCGKAAEELPPLYPVTGKVVKHGKPVQGGTLQFSPVNEQAVRTVNGHVGQDGKFDISTLKGRDAMPGAPEGAYRVTYVPPDVGKSVQPVTSQKTYKVEPRANDFTFEVGGDEPF